MVVRPELLALAALITWAAARPACAEAQSFGSIDPAATRAYCTSLTVQASSAGSWHFDEGRSVCVFRGIDLQYISAKLRGGHFLHHFSGPNGAAFTSMMLQDAAPNYSAQRSDGRVEYRTSNPDIRHLVAMRGNAIEILTIIRHTEAWDHFFGAEDGQTSTVAPHGPELPTRQRCAAEMLSPTFADMGHWEVDEEHGLCVFRGPGVFVGSTVESGGHVTYLVSGANREPWVRRLMGPVRRLPNSASMRPDGAADGSVAYLRDDQSAIVIVRVSSDEIWVSLIERGTETWNRDTAPLPPTSARGQEPQPVPRRWPSSSDRSP